MSNRSRNIVGATLGGLLAVGALGTTQEMPIVRIHDNKECDNHRKERLNEITNYLLRSTALDNALGNTNDPDLRSRDLDYPLTNLEYVCPTNYIVFFDPHPEATDVATTVFKENDQGISYATPKVILHERFHDHDFCEQAGIVAHELAHVVTNKMHTSLDRDDFIYKFGNDVSRYCKFDDLKRSFGNFDLSMFKREASNSWFNYQN